MSESKENQSDPGPQEEEGASMIEYVLMVVFVAILAIAAIRFFGQSVSQNFSEIADSVCPAFGCTNN